LCALKYVDNKTDINSTKLSSALRFTRPIHLVLSLVMDRGAEWWSW